ncbi:MAG: protein arginine kinase [Thermacetogeniaceae bacterium]|jgi:protein arginine kinase
MSIQETLNNAFTKWMEGEGPEAQIVISSRVRLARNLAGQPFPHLMSQETGQAVVRLVQDVIADPAVREKLGPLFYVPLNDLSALDRQILMEKHLISPQHAQDEQAPRGVILRPDEAVSIMVNEEDHLRVQVLLPAFQLGAAWRLANLVDDVFESRLDFAFDEQYGYLSCCPTNVGTGLRASVMMHLPALAMTNQANGVFTTLSKVGFVVRGLYGEGTEAKGNLFQVSNQVTLGLSEIEILDKLVMVSRQVIEQEQMGRRSLMQERRSQIEDMVFRAYGLLTNARLLNSEETMFYLSCLRLGIDLGLLHNVSIRTLNELLVRTRAAFLQGDNEDALDAFNRSLKRAAIIRKALAADPSSSAPGGCPLAGADPTPPLAGADRGSRFEGEGNDQESP